MRKLLNTLFITAEDLYLSLENENVLVWHDDKMLQKFPLKILESILYFSRKNISPALLGACVKNDVGFAVLTPNGRLLGHPTGLNMGNILVRKAQFRISDDENLSLKIAKMMITGKILNARTLLMRALRNHGMSLDNDVFATHIQDLKLAAKDACKATDLDNLRGIEGSAATMYFSLFDDLILQDKKHFFFHDRNKRPPKDRVNALLSFAYTLLAIDCANALVAVGLDAYAGFLHRDRSGRYSLALDLMEELRTPFVDRLVLSLINNRVIHADDFRLTEDGAILLNDKGRNTFLTAWQDKKRETLKHPFLGEKIYWGLVPYIQALLLSRYIRGDLDLYPPFFWK